MVSSRKVIHMLLMLFGVIILLYPISLGSDIMNLKAGKKIMLISPEGLG